MSSAPHFLQSISPSTIVWILLGLYVVRLLFKAASKPLSSGLRHIPGPENPSTIWGHIKMLTLSDEPTRVHEGWIKKYGHVTQNRTAFGGYRLMTTDTRAVSHILSHAYDFPKPDELRNRLGDMVGRGLLFAEGDVHKRQRRVMNPSFGPAQIRNLTPIFLEKSQELRDVWLDKIAKGNGVHQTDVMTWLSRATLDIIGLAGFDYEFSALTENSKAKGLVDSTFPDPALQFSYPNLLRHMFPILKVMSSTTESETKNREDHLLMAQIGRELVQLKKKELIADAGNGGAVDKSSVKSRDLLSLLIKANMASDIPASQKMSDEEVMAQISTFLIAGHETTASSTTWALFELSQHPEVQAKLRAELTSVSGDNLTMEELMALPYLDAVVKEALRFRPVVIGSGRLAAKDTLVPLSKPYRDTNGVLRHEIPMKAGDPVFIPIALLNKSKEIWGEDADQFNPDRWNSVPKGSSEIPSVFSHLATFLAGPRACIGHRFAVVEMKALLFMLVRDISFDLAVPAKDIQGRTSIVTRPVVVSQIEKGYQLPMILRAAQEQ
ncbi:hypothetical protein BOTBODRAFT_38429 [Botryobasidium botryosum FD-172 SS1]|uniref:Cytochrome P450 n=1 Tax=Botryobasidium botryosum (strain FD-172 SS1) TaxID=930990 RepID=A0A067LZR7_BOTB1|nr:hypothetical protein BOTBODRAFT_38429 [Botryobasidium botryosum FD-172 SS1]